MAINRVKVQDRAERLVSQGKFVQAIEQYKTLLKDQPNDLTTLNRVGDLMARAGKMSEATHLFSRAAHLYTTGGFFLKAIAIYKKILKLDPNAAEARLRLADLYARGDFNSEARIEYVTVTETFVRQGFDAKAREVYEKLVRMEPASVKGRATLADIYLARGDRARAVAELRYAAGELEKLGRDEGALDLYRRVLDLGPPEIEVVLSSVRAAVRLRAYDLAIATAEALRRKFPDEAGPAEALTEALEMAGRTEEAEELAKTALGDSAEGPVARLVLGRLHARAGRVSRAAPLLIGAARDLMREKRLDEGAVALDVLLTHNPSHIEALQLRLDAARSLGMEEAAGALSARLAAVIGERVQEPAPSATPAPEPVVSAEDSLSREEREFVNERLTEAEVFFRYGLFQKAAGPLIELLDRFPDHLESHQRLKTVYSEQGNRPATVAECLAIARLLGKSGHHEDAIAALMEARNLDPDDPQVREGLERLGVRQVLPRAVDRPPSKSAVGGGDTASAPAASAGARLVSATPESGDLLPGSEDDVGAEFFDLEGEFGDSLADVLVSEARQPASPREEESLEDVFKAFQEKVDEVVDREDLKTHYELAIAYKEMGLLDEAIVEFEYVSKEPGRLIDCCTLLGMCLREKGSHALAESWYRKALESSGVSPAQVLGLRYELGEIYLEMGEPAKARGMFLSVAADDRDYRNVSERIREVEIATSEETFDAHR